MHSKRRIDAARFRTRTRPPPIWILVVLAAFTVYFGIIVYCDLRRPVSPGYRAEARPEGTVLTEVRPTSPAAQAGMVVGDRILAVNGVTIVDSDSWGGIGANYQIGVPMPAIVERGGQQLALTLQLGPESLDYWLTRTGVTLIVFRAAQVVSLIAGVFIAWRRPRDPMALAASWFLLTCVVFVIALPFRLVSVWRDLPIGIRELLWIPYASALVIGPILMTFVTIFPRRAPHAGKLLAITWSIAGAAAAFPLYNAMDLVYRGRELRTFGPNSRPLLLVTTVSLLAAVALIVEHYRRLTDVNERRRLRAVVAGIVVGALPGYWAIVYFWIHRSTNQAASIFESPFMAVVGIALAATPLSLTYAVLRHRLFDISFIVRKGLQHMLARRAVLALVPAIALFMILETLRLHDKTVDTVLRHRGALYLILTGFAFVVFWNRRRWLKAIDRRFFRERYYGYDVMRDVAEQVRRAGSVDRVAPLVVAKIESAMHPEFAALLVRDTSSRVFRAIAAAPAGIAPPDLPDDSKLVALAHVLEQPLDTSVDTDHSALRQLPASDAAFIRDSRIDTIIPVFTPDAHLHALLALGPKRSEEPYAQEDYGVLVTITESLGLLAGHSAPRAETPTLEECRECGACYDFGTRVCLHHDRKLVGRDLPRTLAGRYRLDKRLAEGGMGTVYEALDIALERQVAAKVMRENLASTDGFLARFVDEARLAARLREHPNVVTVFDFGILEDRLPFLIMELLHGRTLRHLLDSENKLSPRRTRAILKGVCSAVSKAHRHGMVHRDLKPENIFLVDLDGGPVPKVLDFGIAKGLSVVTTASGRRETDPMMLIGTLEYMSPEQRRGEQPSRAWDIWSLSLIALEMLSGEPVAANGVLSSIGPWQPGAVLSDTFPQCVDVFNRALSIDPSERFADADTLYRRIAAAVNGVGR
jgi:tRNA A-37 threonylcarbamoyl transferase component Bud32